MGLGVVMDMIYIQSIEKLKGTSHSPHGEILRV